MVLRTLTMFLIKKLNFDILDKDSLVNERTAESLKRLKSPQLIHKFHDNSPPRPYSPLKSSVSVAGSM